MNSPMKEMRLKEQCCIFLILKKKTEKVSNDRYKITLYYDKDDETELLIRVLAFGPVMKVTEPESFIEQIKQRLRMQNNLRIITFRNFFSVRKNNSYVYN